MIHGPVLPQSRDALWALMAGRLDAIQRGLCLVSEGFDCANGRLGTIEGLARDVDGAPVLLLIARADDPLLVPRALDAAAFVQRVGPALAMALPEAGFQVGRAGRVLVIAAGGDVAICTPLLRHASPSLHVCALEPFRIGGKERFAVRWLAAVERVEGVALDTSAAAVRGAAAGAEATVEAAAAPSPALVQSLWSSLKELCLRIDQGIAIDDGADRRRITWNGQPLAEVRETAGGLQGFLPDGSECALAAPADVGTFSNRLLRGYSQLAGLVFQKRAAAKPPIDTDEQAAVSRHAANGHGRLGRNGADSLRAAAAAARLSPEEHSALGSPTSAVGGESEYAALAGDLARIVASQELGRGGSMVD